MTDLDLGRTALAPVIHGEIVDPVAAVEGDDLQSLTAAWLLSFRESADTRGAYRRDITAWLAWCAERQPPLDPLTARRPHVDAFAAMLANLPNPRTGRPLSPASLARRLSVVSSWYGYLLDAGKVTANPCGRVRRPRVDKDHTTTIGLNADEATALREAARKDRFLGPACGAALAGFLVEIGARVSEICALDVEHLGHDSGHRTAALQMKGGKVRTRAVPPDLAAALAAYVGDRTTGPLFLDEDGRRINRFQVAAFVRRSAKAAGINSWARITPHSFRHAWATIARERGAPLEERQYALGHADPRTTQRYDRARASLDRDPSYLVAAATAGVDRD